MDSDANRGMLTTLQEDLELFQRIMRALNAIQNPSIDSRTQRHPASQNIDFQFPLELDSHNQFDMHHALAEDASEPSEEHEPYDDNINYHSEQMNLYDDDDGDEEEIDDNEDAEEVEDDEDEEEDDEDEYYESEYDDEDDESEYYYEDEDDESDYYDKDEDRTGEVENSEFGDRNESDNAFTHYEVIQFPGVPTDTFSSPQQEDISPKARLPSGPNSPTNNTPDVEQDPGDGADLCCWEHGCNGRKFTTRSNLKRHLREKSLRRPTYRCPQCGAVFSRTTARNTHVARGSCKRIRRYSNGRIRLHPRMVDSQ
ncbi:hypothetical protein BX600DRAFT_523665 [Xylariales sp. PMI_506]|nr:hypothetical protein BX600DRAFT_523665 [Xylariales sp. PMI_506]